ncbi:hypothetical protein HDU67_003478 [Dinochytrium kinnereticum]|nr:hypothetical protein HDU67_003478 [Dinochytrium kinnereticum]
MASRRVDLDFFAVVGLASAGVVDFEAARLAFAVALVAAYRLWLDFVAFANTVFVDLALALVEDVETALDFIDGVELAYAMALDFERAVVDLTDDFVVDLPVDMAFVEVFDLACGIVLVFAVGLDFEDVDLGWALVVDFAAVFEDTLTDPFDVVFTSSKFEVFVFGMEVFVDFFVVDDLDFGAVVFVAFFVVEDFDFIVDVLAAFFVVVFTPAVLVAFLVVEDLGFVVDVLAAFFVVVFTPAVFVAFLVVEDLGFVADVLAAFFVVVFTPAVFVAFLVLDVLVPFA